MSRDRAIVDRVFEVAYATLPRAPKDDDLAHLFGFDANKPYHWRVSPDVWRELVAYFGVGDPEKPSPDALLLGEPIGMDDTLPANSMLLEPA